VLDDLNLDLADEGAEDGADSDHQRLVVFEHGPENRFVCYPALDTFLRVSCEDPHTGGRRTFGPYAHLGGTRRPLANSAVHRVGPV
jgi:hypothetical protein